MTNSALVCASNVDLVHVINVESASTVHDELLCYQCFKPVKWLAPDSRCCSCTRCTPEEITWGAL